MKKLTITSDEDNIFFLDSKRIINTELTLIVSYPGSDAFIEMPFGHKLIIESSIIKIVTEDDSPYRDWIYFDGDAEITKSEIKGAIQFERGFISNSKIEGTVVIG